MMGLLGLLSPRVWGYVIVVVGALGTVWYFHHTWYDQGYAAAIADIEAANKKANDHANQGQKSVDDCFAFGGSWDRDRGVCVPAGG